MTTRISDYAQRVWYGGRAGGRWLSPLSALYGAIVRCRRLLYRKGWRRSCRPTVPVIVVGNLTVGGTGKTPLVIWLVEQLAAAGHRPAVISRGYGGRAGRGPLHVTATTTPELCGDEPALIARRTSAIVVVGSDRCADADAAIAQGATVIVADDGLQHYRLARDAEIVVVDGERGFGNARLLPAGPLREPVSRLNDVDYVLTQVATAQNGDTFSLRGDELRAVNGSERQPLSALAGHSVVACAAIGNPARFFDRLRGAGLELQTIALDDHATANQFPLKELADRTVVVTEKDAVKLSGSAHASLWYLPVSAEPSVDARRRLSDLLAGLVPAESPA
ncbi:MAG: tetraacyldisaccharide 4'-kinase [Pseudomonadota bacterium]